MRKILACLFSIFLITPTFGENWIYLPSEAVEQTIKEMVRNDLQMPASVQYDLQVDDNGRISITGFYTVCTYADFNIKTPAGYDKCQRFLQTMIAKAGYGNSEQNKCINELDGMWTKKADGTQECVGRDGFALNYKNACTDKNSGGTCITKFKNVNAQYRVAKGVITELYSNITCQNRQIMKTNTDKYVYCSVKGKPYTFEFKGIQVQGDTFDEKLSVAEMLCRIGNANYGVVYASYGNQFSGQFGGVCRRDNDPQKTITLGDFIKAGTQECKTMSAWAKRFGAYTVGTVENNTVNVADGYAAAKPIRGLCVIRGGTVAQSSLTNELAQFGINNQSFMAVTFDNEDHAVEKITEYIKKNIPNAKNIKCDLLTSRTTTQTNALGLASKTADVIRCTVDGKKVDFQFKSLRETGKRNLKAGIEGLECISANGVFDTRNCRMVGEENCKQLITALKTTCPDCKSPIWNAQDKKCILPDAKTQANINRGIKIATIGGTIVTGVVLAVIPGTQGAAAVAFTTAAADVLVITGATIELTSDIMMESIYNEFATQADQCYGKGEQCAINVLNTYLQKIQSYKKDFEPGEQTAVDGICSKLFDMIPSSSDFWLAFMQNEDVFDPVTCTIKEKTQFWQKARTVGVVMQMVGAFLAIGGAFQRSTEIIGRKVEEKVLAIGGSGGQGERSAFKRLGLRYTFNESAKNVGRLPYMDKAGLKFGASMKNADATKILKDVYGITAEELYNATLNIDTGKVLLPNGKTIEAIIKTTDVIDEGKTITHITYDLTRAVRPTATALLAAGREAHYLSRTASYGLKIPICLEKEDDFIPGDIEVIIEDEEETRPDRIVDQPCAEKDLPANATYGVYTDKGIAKWDCWNEKKQAIVKCSCAARECKDPYIIATNSAGTKLGTCVKQNGQDSLQQCLTNRAGNREGTACCYLKASVAKWDGAHCVCTDKNKEFSIVNGAGVCKLTPQGACVESGGHWGTRSGREECQCGTNQEYSNGIWRDRGLKLKTDEFPTGTCTCLDGYQWKNPKDKSQGCKPM